MTMTLDEAIAHAKERSCSNSECALEHKQLSEWLEELKTYRNNDPKYYYRRITIICGDGEYEDYYAGDYLEIYVGNKEIDIYKDTIEFDSKKFNITNGDIINIGDEISIIIIPIKPCMD